MRILHLDKSRITKDKDPTVEFYRLLGEQFPELELTKENSYISYVKGSYLYRQPTRTVAHITRIIDEAIFVFYYDRLDITEILFNFQFSESELDDIREAGNSEYLLSLISDHFDLNLDPAEFWVDSNFIDFCNYNKDKFRLEATFDNLWFAGWHVLDVKMYEDIVDYTYDHDNIDIGDTEYSGVTQDCPADGGNCT